MGNLDPPYITKFQDGDLMLCAEMPDATVDGQSAGADGQANFLAPTRGRVVHIMGAFEDSAGGIDVATKMRAHRLPAATSSLNEDAVPVILANVGWLQSWTEGNGDYFEKGDVIQIQSDGSPTTAGDCFLQIVFRPASGTDLPVGAFVISGVQPDGTAAYDMDWPSVGDVEILELVVSNVFFTAASWVLTAKKNGSAAVVAVTGTNGAMAAVASGRVTDADRFLSKEDHIRMDGPGVAGAGGIHPYALICRRL